MMTDMAQHGKTHDVLSPVFSCTASCHDRDTTIQKIEQRVDRVEKAGTAIFVILFLQGLLLGGHFMNYSGEGDISLLLPSFGGIGLRDCDWPHYYHANKRSYMRNHDGSFVESENETHSTTTKTMTRKASPKRNFVRQHQRLLQPHALSPSSNAALGGLRSLPTKTELDYSVQGFRKLPEETIVHRRLDSTTKSNPSDDGLLLDAATVHSNDESISHRVMYFNERNEQKGRNEMTRYRSNWKSKTTNKRTKRTARIGGGGTYVVSDWDSVALQRLPRHLQSKNREVVKNHSSSHEKSPNTTTKAPTFVMQSDFIVDPCYPPEAKLGISKYFNEGLSCPDDHALLEVEMKFDRWSPYFSWMLRNETKSRSGPDADNILLQVQSGQYNESSSEGGEKHSATSGTCTYAVCLPKPREVQHQAQRIEKTNTIEARYSLTLFNLDPYDYGMPCPEKAKDECYVVKVDGEKILSGAGDFFYITSRWFESFLTTGNSTAPKNTTEGKNSQQFNINNNSSSRRSIGSTSELTAVSAAGGGMWVEMVQYAPKCTDDVVWNGELFSPISKYTKYRFDQRIFDFTQIATSVSGAHDLWTSDHRRRALCWLLHDDRRQVSSDDPLLVQRYVMAVLHYATNAQASFLHNSTFHHSGNECDWFMRDEWNDSCFGGDVMGYNSYFGVGDSSDQGDVHVKENKNIRVIMAYPEARLFGTLPHEMFTGLKHLESLVLYEQGISGTIPSEIGMSTEMETIDLFGNELTGSIPSEIGNLSSLKFLWIYGSHLEGTISPLWFPPSSKLIAFFMERNQLDGTIPHEIGNAVNLRALSLAENNLNGTIPLSLFTNCTQLTHLSLAKNILEGTIPNVVRNLKRLERVQLEQNRLSGSLPSGLGQLPFLKTLGLHNNQLSGSITSDIIKASNLEYVHLAGNRLTGMIPRDIGNLTKMNNLHLSDNLLEGVIPSSLWNVSFEAFNDGKSVPALDLRKNANLRGEIPDDFCDKMGATRGKIIVDDSSWMRIPRVNCSCCNSCDEGDSQNNCGISVDNGSKDGCPSKYYSTWIEVSASDDFEIFDVENNQTILSNLLENSYEAAEEDFNASLPVMGCYRAIFYTLPAADENRVSVPSYRIKYQDTILVEEESRYGAPNETYVSVTFGLSIKATGAQFDNNNAVEQPGKPILEVGSCDSVPHVCDGMTFDTGTVERRMLNHLSHYGMMDFPDLFDLESPRRRALCFVLQTSSKQQQKRQMTRRDEVEQDICTGQLLQRYVLALLMFNNHAWEEEELFYDGGHLYPSSVPSLSPFCVWRGITCADTYPTISIVTGINLSHKNLTGTLPSELMLLTGLQSLVLNNNDLSGTIPEDLPLLPLKQLNLGSNRLEGTLPDSFIFMASQSEELILSNNLLAGTLTILSDTRWDLKHLDLSQNFFTGTIPSGIFESSTSNAKNLRYLDLSRNSLHGKIPSSNQFVQPFLEMLSFQGNSLSGTIPSQIFTNLTNLTTLRLNSNRLTGSIPTEVGLAQRLTSLTLNHNELRGTIPKELERLDERKQIRKLLLHGNTLMGSDTPKMDHLNSLGGDSFVSDCGNPFFLLPSKLVCNSCTVCCNSKGDCQSNTPNAKSIIDQTLIFLGFLVLLLVMFCGSVVLVRQCCNLPNGYRNVNPVDVREQERRRRGAQRLCGTQATSVYSLLLSSNLLGWIIYAVTYALQILTFVIFLNPADFHHENSDWQYSKRCPANSLECDDESNVTEFGWFIFSTVLSSKLAVDIFNGFVLLYKSCSCAAHSSTCTVADHIIMRVRLVLSGSALVVITSLAAWTSIVYNRATATTDTELVYNAVILLFVNDLDELVYMLVATVAPNWMTERHREMENMYNKFVSPNRNRSGSDIDIDERPSLPVSATHSVSESQQKAPEI